MWGWVHRKREYWLAGPDDNIETIKPVLPQGLALVKKGQDHYPRVMVALDAKVCPGTVVFSHGYVQEFSPQVAVADYNIPVFHTFTQEFYHPYDRSEACNSSCSRAVQGGPPPLSSDSLREELCSLARRPVATVGPIREVHPPRHAAGNGRVDPSTGRR